MNGGWTHIRYCHRTFPTLVEIVCPKCHHRAVATLAVYDEGFVKVMDIDQYHDDWSILCTNCPYRAGSLTWSGLKKIRELYFKRDVIGTTFWAWNREHLHMLLLLLEEKDISNHPYKYFATYAKGDWLRKPQRLKYAKAAHKMLED